MNISLISVGSECLGVAEVLLGRLSDNIAFRKVVYERRSLKVFKAGFSNFQVVGHLQGVFTILNSFGRGFLAVCTHLFRYCGRDSGCLTNISCPTCAGLNTSAIRRYIRPLPETQGTKPGSNICTRSTKPTATMEVSRRETVIPQGRKQVTPEFNTRAYCFLQRQGFISVGIWALQSINKNSGNTLVHKQKKYQVGLPITIQR